MSKNLTSEQLAKLKLHWPLKGELTFHREVANKVFLGQLDGREVVLRLTEPQHRGPDEIESELAWAFYLASNGMSVASPIKTTQGQFCAEITSEKKYYAAVFEKAQGQSLDLKNITAEQIKSWGQYLGKMHQLTKSYKPLPHLKPRQEWREDASLTMALRSLDPSDSIPYTRMHELLDWMSHLPKNKDEYGLIHCDLHSGNFFVQGGLITAFDFDDCCHHWFSYDFTPPLFSIGMNEKNLELFLEGYNRENKLADLWIKRIPLFFKFRKALLFYWLQTAMKEKQLDQKHVDWAQENFPLIRAELADELNLI